MRGTRKVKKKDLKKEYISIVEKNRISDLVFLAFSRIVRYTSKRTIQKGGLEIHLVPVGRGIRTIQLCLKECDKS
jgi:hypothetical protein